MFLLNYNDLTQNAKDRLNEYVANILKEEFKNQNDYTDVDEYVNDNLDNKLYDLSHSLDSFDRIEFVI